MNYLKKTVLFLSLALCLGGFIAIGIKGMTISPYASSTCTPAKIDVRAWFNSGYKTTSADSQYGVKKNAYIKQCWVSIKEGSYDHKEWSESFTKKEKRQGSARLSKVNNPFLVSTASWGWKYN